MVGRAELTDAEWERLAPFLPAAGRRGGRWSDHRKVINGVLYRARTGVPWRDLPERYQPWQTVYKRHRRWSADGTWERLLARVQAEADAVGDIDWEVSADSTTGRAHQHAAGAPKAAPPAVAHQKGGRHRAKRGDPVLVRLAARLAEAANLVSAWDGRAADSPPRST